MIANMAMIGTLNPNSQRLCQHTGYVSAAFSYLLLAGERATTNRFPDLWELLFCYEIEINCVNRINLIWELPESPADNHSPLSHAPLSHTLLSSMLPLSHAPSQPHPPLIHAPSQPCPFSAILPLSMPPLSHTPLSSCPFSTTPSSQPRPSQPHDSLSYTTSQT